MNNNPFINIQELHSLHAMWPTLTRQEVLCFHLTSVGLTRTEIASELGVTKNAMDKTLQRISKKLDTRMTQLSSVYFSRLLFTHLRNINS